MAKRSAFIMFLLTVFLTSAVMAEDHPEHKGADIDSDARSKNEILTKLESSKAYLKTAEKIVLQGDNREAAAILKNAYLMLKEGMMHYESKQYTYSAEDLTETIQLATHAMILASNEQNLEIRDLVMYEESFQNEKKDAERNEGLIRNNMEEALTFINAAERILRRFPDEGALRKLSEAQESLTASKAALDENNYTDCLEELNKAYKLATRAINEAYKSHGISYVSNTQPR